MNYHGIPVKEFTSDKPVQFAEDKAMLVWNDNPSRGLSAIVFAHDVIYYDPRVPKNRVLTLSGDYYDHCAEIPKEDDGSRFATCGELKAWLALHPTTYVVGKAFKDGFSEPRSSQATDYNPTVEVLDKPCNDNGIFNVSGVLFVTNLTKLMVPTTSNLIYGMEGLYEPSAEQIQRNESAFANDHSVIVVEHKAVSGVNRYAFGKFSDKERATAVANGIIEYLGGSISEGSKDVYVVPTAALISMPKLGCDDSVNVELIPAYIKSAYYCALDKVFPKKCDPITGISMTEGLPAVQAAEEVARENSNKDANSRQATAFDLVRSEIAKRCEDDNLFMPKVWM